MPSRYNDNTDDLPSDGNNQGSLDRPNDQVNSHNNNHHNNTTHNIDHDDYNDTHSLKSHHSHHSHYSHRSQHSRRSIGSRTSHRYDATLAQAAICAPPASVSRSLRFSYPHSATALVHNTITKGNQSGKLRPLNGHKNLDREELSYQQEARYINDKGYHSIPTNPQSHPLLNNPHSYQDDINNDNPGNDLNDSDEEPQEGSGIPFSIAGHLKYPPSEHLRYEYVRNDAYHHDNIPLFHMTQSQRHKIVAEQEHLLKRISAQEMASKKQDLGDLKLELNKITNDNSNATMTSDLINKTIPTPSTKLINSDKYNLDNNNQEEEKEEEESPYLTYTDEDFARPSSLCDFSSRAELLAQLLLALPLALSFSAGQAVGLVNLSYQGHLDEKSLAAAAIALFYQNVSGNSIVYGLNAGIDSFGSQYFGAGSYKMVGLVGLRGAAIGTIAMLFISILWWFAAIPLGWFGMEKDICELAEAYTRMCLFGLPAVHYLDVIRRVLEVQQICVPSMLVNVIGVIFVAPLNWFFMEVMGYGFFGPAYSFIIINYAMFFALLGYCFFTGIYKHCFPDKIFSMALLQNWGQYLSVALPAVGAVAGEWLAFELQTIIAVKLNSTSALAAQSLIISINSFSFNVPMSLGIACSCRVGAFLGARKPSAALLAYHTSLRITWVSQLIIGASIWIFQDNIIRLFTSIPAVHDATQTVMPMISLFVIIDGFQGMTSNVLRGYSAQSYAFFANMTFFWIIALPLSYYLSLHVGTHDYGNGPAKGLGLIGIWCSLLVGTSLTFSSYLIFLGCSSWTKRTNYIYDLLREEEQEQIMLSDKMNVDGEGDEEVSHGYDRDGDYYDKKDYLRHNDDHSDHHLLGEHSNITTNNKNCHKSDHFDSPILKSKQTYGSVQ